MVIEEKQPRSVNYEPMDLSKLAPMSSTTDSHSGDDHSFGREWEKRVRKIHRSSSHQKKRRDDDVALKSPLHTHLINVFNNPGVPVKRKRRIYDELIELITSNESFVLQVYACSGNFYFKNMNGAFIFFWYASETFLKF
jgi:hypothetical protein